MPISPTDTKCLYSFKDSDLILVVKDGNTDIIVELKPVKGKPGEYVDYNNPNAVYIKTRTGKFRKKTSS